MDDYVAILIYGPWLGSWILDFGRSSFAAPPGLDFGAWILDFVIFARALHKESSAGHDNPGGQIPRRAAGSCLLNMPEQNSNMLLLQDVV